MAGKKNPLKEFVGKNVKFAQHLMGLNVLEGEVLAVDGTLVKMNVEDSSGNEEIRVFDLRSPKIRDFFVREREGKQNDYDELYDTVGKFATVFMESDTTDFDSVEKLLVVDGDLLITRRTASGNVYTSFFTLSNGRTEGTFSPVDEEEEEKPSKKSKKKKPVKKSAKVVEEEEEEEDLPEEEDEDEDEEEVYEDDDEDEDDDLGDEAFDDEDLEFDDDDDDDWEDD